MKISKVVLVHAVDIPGRGAVTALTTHDTMRGISHSMTLNAAEGVLVVRQTDKQGRPMGDICIVPVSNIKMMCAEDNMVAARAAKVAKYASSDET